MGAVLGVALALNVAGQSFRILSVTPVRTFTIPTVPPQTARWVGVCLATPDTNLNYVIQVATNLAGPWRDRTGFTAHNGSPSCWTVELTAQETNRFFLRARSQP